MEPRKHVTVVDPLIPAGRLMFAEIEVAHPYFTISEVVKVFFDRSTHWLRLNEKQGNLKLDGEPVAQRRTKAKARVYSLADVELIAHALAQNNVVDARQLALALRVVRAVGMVYGYFPWESPVV